MRIKSDFKDYYDVAQAMGQDLDFVYFRYPKVVQLKTNPWKELILPRRFEGTNKLTIKRGALGFCGKIYPFFELSKFGEAYHNYCVNGKEGQDLNKEAKKTRKFCFNINDVDSFVTQKYPKEIAFFNVKPSWSKYAPSAGHWTTNERRAVFEDFFEKMNKTANSFKYLFEENHSPIFTINIEHDEKSLFPERKSAITKLMFNDSLKQFDFFRMFEPSLAYQEISSFLGGLAVPNKPMPIHSDEMKAEIAGFDKKYSFRTPATKRKYK